jgi:dTDP-4-dehydrorhamnose 3,5-epimerase
MITWLNDAEHLQGAPVAADHWIATEIVGVMRRKLSPIGDQRGSFTELWRASQTPAPGVDGMAQANLSRSRAGVLRGMHFHRRQADLWIVVEGRAIAATTDLRRLARDGPVSVTSQVTEMATGDALYIPSLVAHGFWALADLTLMYLVSTEYDGTDEHGFAWNDPDAAIGWPAGEPIVSDRDRANPTLAELARTWDQHSDVR